MESAEPNQQFCLRWNNHLGNMVNVFEDLFQKESFTDVNIVVQDGMYLKCHKLVLAACSSYFRKIFCNIPEQQPTILLKDITYTQMKAILEYMYKGHTSIPSEELPNLLCIGEWLKIKGLVNTEAENEVSQTSKLNRKRNNTDSSTSLSPDICTSTATQNQQHPDNNGHSSPPHSTSSSTFYGRSPISRGAYDSRIPNTWSSPYTGHNYSSLQQQASSLSAQHTSYFASQYEALGSQSKLMNYLPRNDPILRRVLDKGHVDSSQGVAAVAAAAAAAALPLVQPDPVPDYHTTASNGSANDNLDLRRSSIEHPQPHSSYDNLDEPEKKRSAKSTDLNKSQQKPEWKRYKQYSKSDITSAIEAVRGGMSALQASRKFHVPSRTLYDKVKKLGVGGPRTNRTRSSQSNNDSGKFPLNVGHNINGNIYGSLLAHNERGGLMDEAASLLHSAFGKSQDNSTDGEGGMVEAPEDSSSPPPSMHQGYGVHHSMDDEVEDLSIKSKTEPRLMMSPTIKDEVPDAPEDFSRASS